MLGWYFGKRCKNNSGMDEGKNRGRNKLVLKFIVVVAAQLFFGVLLGLDLVNSIQTLGFDPVIK